MSSRNVSFSSIPHFWPAPTKKVFHRFQPVILVLNSITLFSRSWKRLPCQQIDCLLISNKITGTVKNLLHFSWQAPTAWPFFASPPVLYPLAFFLAFLWSIYIVTLEGEVSVNQQKLWGRKGQYVKYGFVFYLTAWRQQGICLAWSAGLR